MQYSTFWMDAIQELTKAISRWFKILTIESTLNPVLDRQTMLPKNYLCS